MSGFIPMVSTTPPPIDEDDDFGDFMDSAQQDDADFADFPSPVSYEDYSYPSLNSPPDVTNTMGFSSKELSPDMEFEKDGIKRDDEEVATILGESGEGTGNDTVNKSAEFQSLCASSEEGTRQIPNSAIVSPDPPNMPSDIDTEDTDDWLNIQGAPFEHGAVDNDDDTAHDQGNSAPVVFNSSPEPNNGEDCDQHTVDDVKSETVSDLEVPKFEEFQETILSHVKGKAESLGKSQQQTEQPDESCMDHAAITVHCDAELLQTAMVVESEDLQPFQVQTVSTEAQSSDSTNFANPEVNSDFAEFVSNDGSRTDSQFESNPGDNDVLKNHEGVSESPRRLESSVDSEHEYDFANFASPTRKKETDFDAKGGNSFSDFKSSSVQRTEEDFQPDVNDDAGNEKEEFGDFSDNTELRMDQAVDETDFDTVEASDHSLAFECDFNAFDSNTEKSADDFADFSNAGTPAYINETSPDDAEFADFSANSVNDNDFADFSSGPASLGQAFSTTVTKKLSLTEKVANYVSKHSMGQVEAEQLRKSLQQLDEYFIADDTPSKDVDLPSTASVESMGIVWPGDLWDQLEDIDNAIALNFLWNGSGHNKHLLDSLGMLTQNILFSGAKQAYYVPTYYAAGLDLVDPSKGVLKPMSAAEIITAISPTDKTPPNLKDQIMPQETHHEWKTIADEHGDRPSVATNGSWLRSDQITSNHACVKHSNSNDPVRINSPAMDLDFFDRLPGTSELPKQAESTDLIDPELLELTSAPTTQPPPPPKDPRTATLSKILASIKGGDGSSTITSSPANAVQDNSKWEEEENKLSAEARTVLKKLPDLSYMRAKVLMFPMDMSRVNMGEDV